jgi:low affinity Fe/Cu permease
MVFLIQNTQNREARVTQLKLDELIRAVKQARNRLVAMKEMPRRARLAQPLRLAAPTMPSYVNAGRLGPQHAPA